MYRRLSLRLLCLLLTLALPASAQFTRDNAANKKIDEAINEHYLATDFDKAEGVLTGTVTACGDKCSPQVIARAWMYVAMVYLLTRNLLGWSKTFTGRLRPFQWVHTGGSTFGHSVPMPRGP